MDIEEIRKLWDEFSAIPVDNDDRIEEGFKDFPAGTDRFEVWRWFDRRCPNGVARDIFGAV
jgi:hypothetical protein